MKVLVNYYIIIFIWTQNELVALSNRPQPFDESYIENYNDFVVSIPLFIENHQNGSIINKNFTYYSNSSDTLESTVYSFCEDHKIYRHFCMIIMEESLKQLSSSNIEKNPKSSYRDIEVDEHAYHSHLLNKFRSKYYDILMSSSEENDLKEHQEQERQLIDQLMDRFLVNERNHHNYYMSKTHRKICFIHSTTLPQRDNKILIQILEIIRKSRLMVHLDHIWVFNYGNDIDNLGIFQLLYPKVVFIQRSKDTMFYEIPTLRHIHDFSKRLLAYNGDLAAHTHILYLHTKGISYVTHTEQSYYNHPVHDWRNLMLYYLVEKHIKCHHLLLSEEFDTIGLNYKTSPRYYSGNMWWALSSYIATLPSLNLYGGKYDAEIWLLKADRLRAYILHESIIDHYSVKYPRLLYTSDSPLVTVDTIDGIHNFITCKMNERDITTKCDNRYQRNRDTAVDAKVTDTLSTRFANDDYILYHKTSLTAYCVGIHYSNALDIEPTQYKNE